MPMLFIVVVVAVAAAAGVAVYAGRRKRMAPGAAPEQRVASRPHAAVPYKPVRAAATTAAPPVADGATAKKAIEGTEKALAEAEKVGLDIAKARQSFKIAKNFYGMGKYQKAIDYCKTAEDNIE